VKSFGLILARLAGKLSREMIPWHSFESGVTITYRMR